MKAFLAKLKEAELVNDRRDGVFVYYRMAGPIRDNALGALWEVLRRNTEDPRGLAVDFEGPADGSERHGINAGAMSQGEPATECGARQSAGAQL